MEFAKISDPNLQEPIKRFLISILEVDQLVEAHVKLFLPSKNKELRTEQENGNLKDYPSVFMKSAVLLLLASFEGFMESILEETILVLIKKADSPKNLPVEFQKYIEKN